MYRNCPESAQLLYTAADATWRSELEKASGRKGENVGGILPVEDCGEPGSLVRTAYEVRERAYAFWQEAQKFASSVDAVR